MSELDDLPLAARQDWEAGDPPPMDGPCADWWQGLINRLEAALAESGCLIYSDHEQIMSDLECDPADLLTLAEAGRIKVAKNSSFLRVLPARPAPLTA